MKYKIENTSISDLDFIYGLFENAIDYQKKNSYTVWKGYDKKALIKDLENQLQYKIVQHGDILCVFSICYTDKIIWREMEQGNALYIHRMVTNPNFRGQKLFSKVLEWTSVKAKEKKLSFIRMDTWADNPKIVRYYKSFGFQFIENYTTTNSIKLPLQHRNLALTLLQYNIKNTNMIDFIDQLKYFGLSARIKRLSDSLNSEARKMYEYLNFDIEPNWHLVFLSLKEQSLSVTEIAKRLQFSHPAIVKIIKKMKERGYVKSIQDKKDSRKQLLSLTSKGKKMMPKFEKEWNNIQTILNECSTKDFIANIQFFEEKINEKPLLQRLKELQSIKKNK